MTSKTDWSYEWLYSLLQYFLHVCHYFRPFSFLFRSILFLERESRGSGWLKHHPPFKLLCFCPWEQIEKEADQHIWQQRERDRSLRMSGWTDIEEMPGGTRSLCFCHLTPQRISRPAACRPSQHACLSLSPTVCARDNWHFQKTLVLMPSLHSGQETAQSNPSFAVEREKKQRVVDRGRGRGQPVGLPLACSSLLGLPRCWVQSSQLSEKRVFAHECALGTTSHRSTLCSRNCEMTLNVRCPDAYISRNEYTHHRSFFSNEYFL